MTDWTGTGTQAGTVTYDSGLSADLSRIRFHIADTTTSSGPRPTGANFTDDVLNALVTVHGTWQRAVAVVLDVLATEWSRYSDITVGPRRESYSQIADSYRKQAAQWRKDNGILPKALVAGVIRVDGYSDDITSDDVDTTSEYARVKIRTWEYPL